jgi:hypothetical protein
VLRNIVVGGFSDQFRWADSKLFRTTKFFFSEKAICDEWAFKFEIESMLFFLGGY